MIVLTDVATKLEELLNGINGFPFQFVVKSQGYHLDSIADYKKGYNLIPVFISSLGGEYNPVPNLHEANFTYNINIYYPVRFKEDFYQLNEFLENTFVGKKVQIGSQNPLCNISPAEYGEIIGIELSRFKSWVEDEYESVGNKIFEKEQEVCEEYMSMTFKLYCTTLGEGFLFGNDIKFTLSAKINGVQYTKELLVWDSSGTGGSISPISEQLIGVDKYAKNTQNITNFNKSIVVYPQNNNFWKDFIKYYNEQNLEKITDLILYKIYKFGFTEVEYTFNQIILSYNENIALGEPLSFTLTFGD